MKYEMKPEAQRLKHPPITKKSPFSVSFPVSSKVGIPFSQQYLYFCAQTFRPEVHFSSMEKNSGIVSKYIPAAICFTYLHIPIAPVLQ